MAADARGPYGDSNLFLAVLNGEPDRAATAAEAMNDAARTAGGITTSIFTLTEVAYTSRDRLGDGAHDLRRIDAAMRRAGIVRFVEVTESIALLGREYVRAAGRVRRRLAPADAVHLATAETVGASIFWTFDERLMRLAELLDLPFPVREPGT